MKYINPIQEFYQKYPELNGVPIRMHDGVPIWIHEDGTETTIDTVHPSKQIHTDLMILKDRLDKMLSQQKE